MKNIIASIANWFREARPEPTRKDWNTQLGVHFEEVGEMLAELTAQTPHCAALINSAQRHINELSFYLKTNPNAVVILDESRIGFLDSLCDQIVTAIGCAHAQDMEIDGATAEVDRSNWSKFVNGKAIFDGNGKIAKGPEYSKADLTPFV